VFLHLLMEVLRVAGIRMSPEMQIHTRDISSR